MDWIPRDRRKRGSPRKTWMEGVQATMTTTEEWRLVSGRWRQMFKKLDR